MVDVTFVQTTSSSIDSIPVTAGQIIFVTDTTEIYLDTPESGASGSPVTRKKYSQVILPIDDISELGQYIGGMNLVANYSGSGFNDGHVSSGSKSAYNDTVQGIYIGVDASSGVRVGELGIGSSNSDHIIYDGQNIIISSSQLNTQIDSAISQVSDNLNELEDGLSEVNSNLSQLSSELSGLETRQSAINQSNSDALSAINSRLIMNPDDTMIGSGSGSVYLKIDGTTVCLYDMSTGEVISKWGGEDFKSSYGEFTDYLKLGKFAFMPRSNGNLSFVKVED